MGKQAFLLAFGKRKAFTKLIHANAVILGKRIIIKVFFYKLAKGMFTQIFFLGRFQCPYFIEEGTETLREATQLVQSHIASFPQKQDIKCHLSTKPK